MSDEIVTVTYFQGGPFESAWQTRYAKLYPNRLELHAENNKAQLIFMEDIEDINTELVTVSWPRNITNII